MAGNDREHLKQQQAKLHHVADRGTPATIPAKEATSSIPIVVVALGDPGSGIVPVRARPGSNMIGFSAFFTELAGSALN
jgi:ABC-type uncharacterized transport system substrate-binding protein